MFDDYPNLSGLTALRESSGAYAWVQYVGSGISSVLGRPVALLSFAAQAASWDGHPEHFLVVNVLLHLANGALWFAVLVRLQRLGASGLGEGPAGPLLICALWLLLPIHGSAVLYVVQRMTLLATAFMLAGIWAYLHGRFVAAHGRLRAGYLWMSGGATLGTLLGTLSKETAATLPLLLLAIEATVLRARARPTGWKAWSACFLALPCALLMGYLAVRFPAFLEQYTHRSFTMSERLITEGRVLFIYLAHAFVPDSAGIRLLHDDFVLSRSLLQPWTGALALAAWGFIVGAAVLLRHRAPALALAVAWFLLGHALESTFIALEIAFDHRNYLPLLGVSLGLGAAFLELRRRAGPLMRRVVDGGIAAYLALLGLCLWLSTSLWGEPLAQAQRWAERQPESPRAAQYYGEVLLDHGKLGSAAQVYEAAGRRWPDDAVLALSFYRLGCFQPAIGPAPESLLGTLARYPGADAHRAASVARLIADHLAHNECPHGQPDELLRVLETMVDAPGFRAAHCSLRHTRALLLDALGRKPEALVELEAALAIETQVPLLQQAILWSLQLGDSARARGHLETAERSPGLTGRTRWLYREEIRGARQLVELYESL